MKYKVGDVVRLKSAEELMRLGYDMSICNHIAGKNAHIINRDEEEYLMLIDDCYSVHLLEDTIERTILKWGASKNDEYSLDGLQSRVNDFKEYLAEVNKRNECLVDVMFNTIDCCDMAINSQVTIKK